MSRIVASFAPSAPTISCVLCPAGEKRCARRPVCVRSALRLVDLQPQRRHRAADRGRLLLRRERLQRRLGRQLDVDRQPVGAAARLRDQRRARLRDRLQMDVAAEEMLLAQRARDRDQLLHRVVGRLDDAGGKEQPLDVVAPVEGEREIDDLLHAEARARHVGGAAVDAIGAVVEAEVRQQDLQQRHAAAVRRVGMADAHAGRGAEPALAARVALRRAGRRAGHVILRRVGEDGELLRAWKASQGSYFVRRASVNAPKRSKLLARRSFPLSEPRRYACAAACQP